MSTLASVQALPNLSATRRYVTKMVATAAWVTGEGADNIVLLSGDHHA